MADYKFDANELNSILLSLSLDHRIAFAAACCERMLPNFTAFSKAENWGNPAVLRSALNEIWKSIEESTYVTEVIRDHISTCELMAPDTEEFSSTYTSAALDAANAVLETLECCLDHNTTRIIDVASFARDTVDMYIQDQENLDYSDPLFEKRIISHPLMIKELKNQSEDLRFLLETPILNENNLQSLRKSSEAKSNIDLT